MVKPRILKNVSFVAFFLIFTFILSCNETYWPKINASDERLVVVDGHITNSTPCQIELSYASRIYNVANTPITGCEVSLKDNCGNIENLTESVPGTYASSDSFKGIIGRSYKLIINTPSSQTYESTFERLNTPTSIKSVYNEIETKYNPNQLYSKIGYQFYVNTKEAIHDTNYFLWRLKATYEYNVDFKVKYIFDKGILKIFPNPDSIYKCWHTYTVNKVFTFSTEKLSTPIVDRFPLHFVSTETRQLSIRYSLLVKQYSLTRNAYIFWNELEKLHTSDGVFNVKQPFQVKGNISNINNPNETVLGYFFAAGIEEKRVFFDKPPLSVPFYYSKCELKHQDFSAYNDLWMTDPGYWPIYITTSPDGARAVPHPACIDCRESAGVIVKPDFWIDE